MLKSLLLLATATAAAAPVAAVPLDEQLFDRSIDVGSHLHLHHEPRASPAGDPEGSGFHSGYYYTFRSDGRGSVTYTNLANGSYTASWKNAGYWVGGKGWSRPGGGNNKTVQYSGTWDGRNSNTYLALYGRTRDPLVEYYVVESYGTYIPSGGAQRRGSVAADGGTYDIYRTLRVVDQQQQQPSVEGEEERARRTFYQFWSVRTTKRVGGQITTGTHFDAWSKSGLALGTHDYMILATEGYHSSGSSSITVWEVGKEREQPYPDEPDSRRPNSKYLPNKV